MDTYLKHRACLFSRQRNTALAKFGCIARNMGLALKGADHITFLQVY